MGKDRLSKDTWLAAGFKSLADRGPTAIQINHLAKLLGATKGSFYWHFKDIAEFKMAMLDLWKTKVANEVIADVAALKTPLEQLDAVLANAMRPAPDDYGGLKIEPAMRAWALSDPDVAVALADLDDVRLAFLKSLLEDLGLNGGAMAALVYGAYIGLDDLQSKGRTDHVAAFAELRAMVLRAAQTH